MTDNPYTLEADKKYTLNFSGGRSSAYMLRKILDAYGGELPDHIQAVFANTGKEFEQTLDFVHACETRWNVPITWLEYRYDSTAKGGKKYPKNTYKVVDYETASRKGEPFSELVVSRGYLPNVMQRICTSELKVNTISRYMLHEHGLLTKRYHRVLGIRYDEPRRWGKALYESCDVVYPMVAAKVTKQEVNEYWRYSPFNLGLDYDSIRGNCDLCYLKGRDKLRHIIRQEPHRADWWIAQENERFRKGAQAVFMKDTTYHELREQALDNRQVEMDFTDEIDCYCGD